MDTFRPKGSIQWDFDFGRETKKPMITGDYLSWSPSKWSRWEEERQSLLPNPFRKILIV